MKLSEIFSQLAYGELSQLGLVNATGDGIATDKQGQLVAHVNMGLLALYKRFLLKEGSVTIRLVTGRSTYPLNTEEDTYSLRITIRLSFLMIFIRLSASIPIKVLS